MSGKVAIVTGASSGIGEAIAEGLLREGVKVYGVGREFQSDALCQMVMDLREIGGAMSVVQTVLNVEGRLDIVVNAAGILTRGDVGDITQAEWDAVMEMNLNVPFRMMNEAADALKATKGCIVNVSSVNSTRPFPGCSAYNTSKAGLDQLTRTAAVELAPYGVRVNAVNPGAVQTRLHLAAGYTVAEYREWLDRAPLTHPLGRIGTPKDVADAVVWLCSDAASWVTGVTLPVDGGRHLTVVR